MELICINGAVLMAAHHAAAESLLENVFGDNGWEEEKEEKFLNAIPRTPKGLQLLIEYLRDYSQSNNGWQTLFDDFWQFADTDLQKELLRKVITLYDDQGLSDLIWDPEIKEQISNISNEDNSIEKI